MRTVRCHGNEPLMYVVPTEGIVSAADSYDEDFGGNVIETTIRQKMGMGQIPNPGLSGSRRFFFASSLRLMFCSCFQLGLTR